MNEKEWDEVMKHIRDFNRTCEHYQRGSRYIPVTYDEGNNWEFVLINRWDGRKALAIF